MKLISSLTVASATSLFAAFQVYSETPAKFVEYIASSGSGAEGQYLLTDYTPGSDSVVEVVVSIDSTTAKHAVFCAGGTGTGSFSVTYVNNAGWRWDYNATGTGYITGAQANKRYRIRCDGGEISVDGSRGWTSKTTKDYTVGGPMMLFSSYALASGGGIDYSKLANGASMKLYSLRAYDREDGKLVQKLDLWPCVDANGKAGLYDTISATIYRGAGTGELTASENETASPVGGIVFSGIVDADWLNPANWNLARVPTANDDVVIVGKNVLITNAVNVAALRVAGTATLDVKAPELSDYSTIFADHAAAAWALYTNALTVTVTGALKVEDTASVRPENAVISGTPVLFRAGSLTVAEGASFDTRSRGWGWSTATYDAATAPAGAHRRTKEGATQAAGWTLAFGYGNDAKGAGYGGAAYGSTATRGCVYGDPLAPFLPGSPAGYYQNTVSKCRGSGSICIFVAGTATVAGTLQADGASTDYSGASGGGIWLAAGEEVVLGPSAVLTANGNANKSFSGPGGGGRIAIVQGTTLEDLDLFAAGTAPGGYDSSDLEDVRMSVSGGTGAASTHGAAGTIKTISKVGAFAIVDVQCSPFKVAGVDCGEAPYPVGSVTLAAPQYGGDLSDPSRIRYSCAGFVVSNAVGEVTKGTENTCTFNVSVADSPYRVTWSWKNRETLLSVALPDAADGRILVNGEVQDAVVALWLDETASVRVSAVPAADRGFSCWQGDVPAFGERSAALSLSADVPHTLTPCFWTKGVSERRMWAAGRTGDFYLAGNWMGGVVPSPEDIAVVSSGTCTANGDLVVGGIELGGTAKLNIAQAAHVDVVGNIALAGSSQLKVEAVALTESRTFATGATQVSVGGDLTLADSSVIYPVCEPWTGGAVAFRVNGLFGLGAQAAVDAVEAGWKWRSYDETPSPDALYTGKTDDGKTKYETRALAPATGFNNAASHGGLGGNAKYDVYGFANAPLCPGSPTDVFSSYCVRPGGGVVRIHAAKAEIAGRIDASAHVAWKSGQPTVYAGGSGGSIWLTATRFSFGATAVLRAKGGVTSYSSMGGGGRIAIGTELSSAQIEALSETGACERRVKGLSAFQSDFPGVTVDVTHGDGLVPSWAVKGEDGTFTYYPVRKGLSLLVR